jgi:hypothetical protein
MMAILAFCVMGYFSLFIYESEKQLTRLGIGPLPRMSPAAEQTVARSRHSLKLFEDTTRGIQGQLQYFSSVIVAAHQARFSGSRWFPLARLWSTDLGLFLYEGDPISSTHCAAFTLGVEPTVLFAKTGPEDVKSIATEYGNYVAACGGKLEAGKQSFASHMNKEWLKTQDVKSREFYPTHFNGPRTADLNALLSAFQALMNFSARVLPLDSDAESYQTKFKIQYLTLYQVIRSVALVRHDQAARLTPRSLALSDRIVDDPISARLTSNGGRRLRNVLMHYSPGGDLGAGSLDPDAPLYGLVEAYFPRETFESLWSMVSARASEVANTLNTWQEAE